MSFKTNIRLVLIALLMLGGIQPHILLAQTTSFGILAGGHYSFVSASSGAAVGIKGNMNMQAGVFGEWSVNPPWGVRAELSVQGRGYGYQLDIGGERLDLRMNYFQMPLFIKRNVHPNWELLLGPEFSFLLSTKGIFSDNEGVKHPANIKSIQSNLRNVSLGAILGVQYAFNDFLGFYARYQHGFSDVYKGFDASKWLYRGVGVGVQWKLH